MKTRIYGALAVLFDILSFMGIAFVSINRGSVNAGYALVPMIFSIILTLAHKKGLNKLYFGRYLYV